MEVKEWKQATVYERSSPSTEDICAELFRPWIMCASEGIGNKAHSPALDLAHNGLGYIFKNKLSIK